MSIVVHQNYNPYNRGTEHIANNSSNGPEKKDKEGISVSAEQSVQVSISEEGYASYSKLLSERVNTGERVNLFSKSHEISEIKYFEQDVIDQVLSIQKNDSNTASMSYEEKVDFLQKSLKQATELHKIEPGSDVRSKFGYVSTGELMKENDPEFYEEHNKMMTEALEKGDRDLLFRAIKASLDWLSQFEKR